MIKKPIVIILALIFAASGTALGQTSAFTFQGKLTDNSLAANGPYDLVFRLFDSAEAGTQIGTDITIEDVNVSGGLFTVTLDFGQAAFSIGDPRFIQVSVRQGASTEAFTELTPRQEITSSPFAIKSRKADEADTAANAANADNAVNAANAANAAQLGGIAADQYVVTTDPRMSDARPPAPGSSNYIQNTTFERAGNFNISGTGRANILGAEQFNIGVTRVLTSSSFPKTLYVGIGAGEVNTDGQRNTFVGVDSGKANSSASSNSFFGSDSGLFNQFGSRNSFFGDSAGRGNISGSGNSYFGYEARGAGDDGSFNTLMGAHTRVSSGVSNSTAIGAQAQVSASNSLVLGSINGINGATSDTNVGIGTTAPTSRLHVNGAILVTGPRTSTPSGNAMTLSSDATADTIQSFGNRPLSFNPAGNNVGIFTNEPTSRLDVNGTLRVRTLGTAGSDSLCRNANGQISSCSSSLRYKENIFQFGRGLDLIRRLDPITFNWKGNGALDLGLGAEDVAAVDPLLVNYNEKGEVEGVKYDRIGVVLVNAVKEQQDQIASQTVEIDQLKQKLELQRREIAELRALVCSVTPGAGICSSPK